MLEIWLLWAEVETESSAYKGGQLAGKILMAVVAVTVVWVIVQRMRDR